MEIGQLRAFVAAAREKSFTHAAEILSLTQPSVTARIQTLEQELKLPLFLRKGRSISLTDGGKAFLPYAERMLSVLEEAEEAVRNVREGTAGRFTLGANPTLSSNLIAPVLSEFHREYPQVEIFLRSGNSGQVVEMVLDDVVQLGVAAGPIVNQEIRTLHSFKDELIVVVGSHHPFAHRHDAEGNINPVKIVELTAQEFVIVRWGVSFDLFLSRLGDASRNPRISIEVGVTDTAKAMVQSSNCITLLPRFTTVNELHSGALVEIPLADIESTNIEICSIHRRDRPILPPTTRFLELWVNMVEKTMATPVYKSSLESSLTPVD